MLRTAVGRGTGAGRRGTGGPRTAAVVAAGVGLALVGGLAGGALVRSTGSPSRAGTTAGSCPASSVADTVLPSVVTLEVQSGTSSSNGSGEIIRNGGYVLTNDHVVSPAAAGGRVQVVFATGQTEAATLVGRAPDLDLAVVKVADQHGLPVIAVGNAAALRVGQPVVALGAPLGLSGTVTGGIVSALGRDVRVPAENGATATLPGSIQTDASINPGNSGGALVDCRGRLVGINTAIATVPDPAGQPGGGSVGIGFAIPSDLATTVSDQLIATGHFAPPSLGVSTVPLPASVEQQSGFPGGLFVQALDPAGPAAQAGLRVGDVITGIGSRAATGPDTLLLETLRRQPGDQLHLEYVRDGHPATTTVTLAAAPEPGS